MGTVEWGETIRQACLCLYPHSSASPQDPLYFLPHGRVGSPSLPHPGVSTWCIGLVRSRSKLTMVSSHSCLSEEASLTCRGTQFFPFCVFVAVYILLFRFKDQVRLGQPSSLLFPVPISYFKKICFSNSLTISYMSITCLDHSYSQSPPLTPPHPNAPYDHCHAPRLYNPLSIISTACWDIV